MEAPADGTCRWVPSCCGSLKRRHCSKNEEDKQRTRVKTTSRDAALGARCCGAVTRNEADTLFG